MSSGIYLGSNDLAVAGSKGYIGVNGVACGISKIYVGDASGKARLGYEAINVPKKTFAEATDAELLQMVQAADEGKIDLYDDCGWRVGQERTVSISAIEKTGTYDGISWDVPEEQPAQTITLVVMHRGLYDLVTPVKAKGGATRTKCSFILGMKDCMYNRGQCVRKTSSSDASTWSMWSNNKRRDWCNSGFRSALPSDIRAMFKKFKCVTGKYYQGTAAGGTLETTQDYFALPAEKEAFMPTATATTVSSTTNERDRLTQFTWYENSDNWQKKFYNTSYSQWRLTEWTFRSPGYHQTGDYVKMTGQKYTTNWQSGVIGISPFGCV